jgi:hypothetical protein
MFVGHFAVGFAAKRVEPRVSLGTLVLAAMFVDLLWCAFMITGVEHVQFKPGKGAANYFVASNVEWSHSLAMDGLWAALFAGGYFLCRRYTRGAWILILAVLSHWLLDVISHRPDMPLAPGMHTYLGLNLWASVPSAIILEGGFWMLAVIVYALTSHPRTRASVYVYWSGIAVLTLIWLSNLTGPPPPDPRTAPVISLAIFSLFVAWAYWMNFE